MFSRSNVTFVGQDVQIWHYLLLQHFSNKAVKHGASSHKVKPLRFNHGLLLFTACSFCPSVPGLQGKGVCVCACWHDTSRVIRISVNGWCVWLLINRLVSWVCVCIWSVCVLRTKQQGMCLLLWVMKCQWFGLWSRETGCEQRLLFMFCSRRRAQAAGRCCVSSHPSCWDDSPDGFTQFTPNHKLTGKAFVWEHPEARIYICDIFSAKKTNNPDLFLFTSALNVKPVFFTFLSAW